MPCSKFKAGLLTEESVRDHTCDARTVFGCQRPELKHNFSEASFSIEVSSAEELSNDKADRLSRGAIPLDKGGLFFLYLNPILCFSGGRGFESLVGRVHLLHYFY